MLFKKRWPVMVLVFLAVLNLGLFGYLFWQREQKSQAPQNLIVKEETPQVEVSFPTPLPQDLDNFFLPVEKKNIKSVDLVQLDYGFASLALVLREDSLIYAGFSGEIETAGGAEDAQKIIFLKKDDGSGLAWKYLFSGDLLVNNGSRVKEGTRLAKITGLLPGREENVIIQAYHNHEQRSFTQDQLKRFTL